MLGVHWCYAFASSKVFLAFFAQQQSGQRVVVVPAASAAVPELARDLAVLLDTRFVPQLSSPVLVVVELK